MKRKIFIKILLTLCACFLLLTSCAKERRSVVTDAFDAIADRDSKKFYDLLAIDSKNKFLAFEYFESVFEDMELSKSYTTTQKSALQWEAKSKDGNILIKLSPDESQVDPSFYIEKNATVIIPNNAKLYLNGTRSDSYVETVRDGDKYALPHVFIGAEYEIEIEYGDVIKPYKITVSPSCTDIVISSLGFDIDDTLEKSALEHSENFAKAFFYGAQLGRDFSELEQYVSEFATENEVEALSSLYATTSEQFAKFDDEGYLTRGGIFDLSFSESISSLSNNGKNYVSELTLNYSYLLKSPDAKDEDIFDDTRVEITLVYNGESWGVVALDTESLI